MNTSASQNTQQARIKAIVSGYARKRKSKRKTSDGSIKMPVATRTNPASNRNKVAERQPSATQQKIVFERSDSNDIEPSSLGICLLSDITALFEEKKASRFKSRRLINALCKYKTEPWATYSRRGHKIGARQLAALLKEFEIHSKDIRFQHGVAKGYLREWFVDAMRRIKYIYADTQQP